MAYQLRPRINDPTTVYPRVDLLGDLHGAGYQRTPCINDPPRGIEKNYLRDVHNESHKGIDMKADLIFKCFVTNGK